MIDIEKVLSILSQITVELLYDMNPMQNYLAIDAFYLCLGIRFRFYICLLNEVGYNKSEKIVFMLFMFYFHSNCTDIYVLFSF